MATFAMQPVKCLYGTGKFVGSGREPPSNNGPVRSNDLQTTIVKLRLTSYKTLKRRVNKLNVNYVREHQKLVIT